MHGPRRRCPPARDRGRTLEHPPRNAPGAGIVFGAALALNQDAMPYQRHPPEFGHSVPSADLTLAEGWLLSKRVFRVVYAGHCGRGQPRGYRSLSLTTARPKTRPDPLSTSLRDMGDRPRQRASRLAPYRAHPEGEHHTGDADTRSGVAGRVTQMGNTRCSVGQMGLQTLNEPLVGGLKEDGEL